MSAGAPLRSIAVFGGGVVAATAALAFARALPTASVTLVLTPVDAAASADRFPTSAPAQGAVLDGIGIDADALLAAGIACPRLAARYTDWSRDRRPWLAAEGGAAAVPGSGALHQRWLEAARSGSTLPFHALLPAAVLAQAGRYAPHPPGPLAPADRALAFDAAGFHRGLIAMCRSANVRVATGRIMGTDRDAAGRIDAVRTQAGMAIADLYVDATGPAAPLSGDGAFLDWSAYLPADRLLVHPMNDPKPSLLDDYVANDIGWSACWARPDGSVRALAYASGITAQDRARSAAGWDDADRIDVRAGRLAAPWRNNVLALGEAAVQFGPLGLAGYGHALAQIALALELLPGRDMDPRLLAEYDRRASLRADRTCDFLAAHYLLKARRRGAFWQALGDRVAPPGLAATLTQYRRRGLIPHHDEDGNDASAWHAALLGQGVLPQRRDAIAMGTDPRAIATTLKAAAAALASAAAKLPAYGDRLDRRSGAIG